MLDYIGIYQRFAECHGAKRPSDLVKLFDISSATVAQWKTGVRPIPRRRLKRLVDEQGLRWDWLLDGATPKYRSKAEARRNVAFNTEDANARFFNLYPDISQSKLGELFDVSQPVINYWKLGKVRVPWEKLKDAVDQKGVTWEWLLEGREK